MINTKDSKIFLENSLVKIAIDAASGGKVYSFISKKSGAEFLYTDPRSTFYPQKGYSYHNVSGIDECFPTVAQCVCDQGYYKGREFKDHGHLWERKWDFWIDGNRVVMLAQIPEFNISFQRRCSLQDDSTFILEYEISNYADVALPYVYSVHPILFVDEQTRLELPAEVTKVYNAIAADNFGIDNEVWVDLPLPNKEDLTGPYSRSKETFVKFFTPKLSQGWGRLRHIGLGQSLKIEFDPDKLPYMGVLVSQGHDSLQDGDFKGEFLIALEPTTGIGDDLTTCDKTGTVSQLEPGGKINFWIRFSILDE